MFLPKTFIDLVVECVLKKQSRILKMKHTFQFSFPFERLLPVPVAARSKA